MRSCWGVIFQGFGAAAWRSNPPSTSSSAIQRAASSYAMQCSLGPRSLRAAGPVRLLCLRGGADDSPQALKALELFLKVASPAATQIVDEFMASRTSVTVDEFLLEELHRPVRPGEDPGVFVNEWQAFASGAISKDRSNVARRAWKQWRAFGGDDDRATPLVALGQGEDAAAVVSLNGVVRLNGILSATRAAALRTFVLEQRDTSVARAAADSELGATLLSRVLSPKDAGSAEVTRWDVRLPWDDVVRDAVLEIMGGELGAAFSALSGGDDAELFECAAVISKEGAASQIVHSDTVISDAPTLHTAFVALQDVLPHHGPTRFLKATHTGAFAAASHGDLARDDTSFCEAAPSVSAILNSGDCTLYDSRTLHCGGPHLEAPLLTTATERVLFTISFRHTSATEAQLSNEDVHGAGSILPSVAALQMHLGQLRTPPRPRSSII